jgi:uncharacterized C2H2 Zn-finger protein
MQNTLKCSRKLCNNIVTSKDAKRCDECLKYDKEYHRHYYQQHRDYFLAKSKKYAEENKEYYALLQKQHRAENPEQYQSYQREYQKTLRKSSAKKAAEMNLRVRFNSMFSRLLSGCATYAVHLRFEALVGLNFNDFKSYCEQKFQERYAEEINWDNLKRSVAPKGEALEIDHTKQMKDFDCSKEDEKAKCWHYTNLMYKKQRDNRCGRSKEIK